MRDHSEWRRLFLTTAGVVALAVLGVRTAPCLPAQSAAGDKMAFEVASVKSNHSGNDRSVFHYTSERLTATDMTTKDLIQLAYFAQDFQLPKGPEWINSARYDIDAKVPDPIAEKLRKLNQVQQADPIGLMLQSLLADRFKLKVRHVTKEMPVYALVVAKGGSRLTQTTVTPPDPSGSNPQGPPRNGINGRGEITGNGMPVSGLAAILSHQLGRMVLDRTGLKGNYDLKLQWTPDEIQPLSVSDGSRTPTSPNSPPLDSSRPSIFTALQDQLGLRLESIKGPVDVLVIDHIEEPSPN
jgi:uncharacterized protein (TIGR03435 family)